MKYIEDLRHHLATTMSDDPLVHFLGEDVLDPYGGAFKVSSGLSTKFPDRVHTTPISEGAIVGVAAGMALRGIRPIAEIMFGDFLTLCVDQIVNHATKFNAMYNGQVDAPLVIRTPVGAGRGYGPTHSQSLEKVLLGTPYLRVFAPSHVHTPGAMLAAVVKLPGVKLFLEHKLLYPTELFGGDDRISRSEIGDPLFPDVVLRNHAREAADVLLIGYGGASRLFVPALERMAQEEIHATAIVRSEVSSGDVSSLAPLTRAASAVVVVDEGTAGFSWASEISAGLYDQLVPDLRRPIIRLTADATVIPTSRAQEDEVIVTMDKLLETIWRAL